MALTNRQKITILSLLIYWPGIFILSHIPIPKLVYQAQVSDKAIHFIAYLILVFLLWFVLNSDRKINWRKAAVWWVLLIMVGYGIADEVLQGYVGRNCDFVDIVADSAGVAAGLILFSFFTFWPSLLAVTAITIFLLTNLTRTNPAELMPITNAIFHPYAYAAFTILWIRNIYLFAQLRVHKPKWLLITLALPIGLLSVVKLFSVISGRSFGVLHVISSIIAIVVVAVLHHLIALYRQRRAQNLPVDNS